MKIEETLKALEQFSEKMKPKTPTIQDYLGGFYLGCKIVGNLTETMSPLLNFFLNATQPPKRAKMYQKNKKNKSKKQKGVKNASKRKRNRQ